MKTLKLTATLMLLGALTLGAATIDEQIAAIGAAETPQERIELVNEFKETVSALSAEERDAAIAELRATMNKDGEQLQTQTQTRERSRVNQMEQTEEMQRTQQMQQNQAGSQAMQQNKTNAGTSGAGQNRFMGNK